MRMKLEGAGVVVRLEGLNHWCTIFTRPAALSAQLTEESFSSQANALPPARQARKMQVFSRDYSQT
jgi:hypothetical protein